MDPLIAIGIGALTWLAVRDRHEMTRVLLAIGLYGLGWQPASHGSGPGAVLVAMAGGVAASLIWERLLAAADMLWPRRHPHRTRHERDRS